MRYGSISLALICLFCGNAYASLEIINTEEKQKLSQIEDQYDIDALLISVNNKFTQHNKKAFDIEELTDKVVGEKQTYDSLISTLPEKILAKSNLPSVYQQIEYSVTQIDTLEKRIKKESAELKQENAEILAEYEAINKKRTEHRATA